MGLGYSINQKMVLVNSDQYLKGYHQTRVQQKVQNLMVSREEGPYLENDNQLELDRKFYSSSRTYLSLRTPPTPPLMV